MNTQTNTDLSPEGVNSRIKKIEGYLSSLGDDKLSQFHEVCSIARDSLIQLQSLLSSPQPEKTELKESKLVQSLKDYFKNTSKEQIKKDWEEIEKMNFGGPTVEEYFANFGGRWPKQVVEGEITDKSKMNLRFPGHEKKPIKADHLLPCPLCGSSDVSMSGIYPQGQYYISCDECRVSLWDDRKDKAIGHWNCRDGRTVVSQALASHRIVETNIGNPPYRCPSEGDGECVYPKCGCEWAFDDGKFIRMPKPHYFKETPSITIEEAKDRDERIKKFSEKIFWNLKDECHVRLEKCEEIKEDIYKLFSLFAQHSTPVTQEGETLYRKVLTYDKQPQKRGLYDTDMGSLAFNWYNDGYGKRKNEWYDNNTNIQKFPTYWLEELPSTPAAGQEEKK